jgi:hypothetical protein
LYWDDGSLLQEFSSPCADGILVFSEETALIPLPIRSSPSRSAKEEELEQTDLPAGAGDEFESFSITLPASSLSVLVESAPIAFFLQTAVELELGSLELLELSSFRGL